MGEKEGERVRECEVGECKNERVGVGGWEGGRVRDCESVKCECVKL